MSNNVSRTISDQWLNAFMYQESGGRPTAKAPTSTASGLFQFLKGTWRGTVKKHRPDVFQRYPNGELLSMRTNNPSFSIEMGARFNEDNQKYVGMDATIGDLYLAHFMGADTARKVRRADPSTPVSSVVDEAAIRANRSILQGKTCGEVREWSDRVMARALSKAEDYVGRFYRGRFVVPPTGASPQPAEPSDPENVVQRPGLKPHGDYRLYDNQLQLRAMNYNPGTVDGVWGGGTAGAIAGFFNDYAPEARVPTKWNEYDARYAEIDHTVDKAESEGFRRPVTRKRADADSEVVKEIAPEIVHPKQGLWASITAFFGAFGTAVYQFFNWLFDWKDEAQSWGITELFVKTPFFVWAILGTIVLGFLAWKAWETIKGIEKPIITGERM